MVLTVQESIKVADNFIARNLIFDEDLSQEIYLKALELSGEDLTKDMIRKKLKEVVNNFYGKKAIENSELSNTFLSDIDEEDSKRNQEYKKLINDLQARMVRDIITNLLNSLPEVERRIIIETYYNEMTKGELAAILQISEDSVTKYHEQALKKMRQFKNEQSLLRAYLVDMI